MLRWTLPIIFVISLFGWANAQKGQLALDSVFKDWEGTDVPGGVAIVVKDGEILWEKAFGMASLEYLVPNTTHTIFNIASVSKQFTAYGILLLEEEGKLSLDDDIRTYLPEVPDFGEVITIRHMLHHTSGLRSLHDLFHLAGWREDDRRSGEDLLRFLPKQRDLNFSPGSEYLYCNTGFILSAVIIERITGQRFENWMKDKVFSPLGMDHSFFRRDYTQVIPDVATSYKGMRPYSKSIEFWAYIGTGNMHTTTGDLALWLNHVRVLNKQKDPLLRKMWTRGVLTNGDSISYALGVVVGNYQDKISISHGGSIGGFRAYLTYLPSEDLGVAVLSNYSFGNPGGKAQKILNVLVGKESRVEDVSSNPVKPIWTHVSRDEMIKMTNHYHYVNRMGYCQIKTENEDLVFLDWARKYKLGAIGNGKYICIDAPNTITLEQIRIDTSFQLLVKEHGEIRGTLIPYQPWKINSLATSEFLGRYYSPELETYYDIKMQEDKVVFYHPRRGSVFLQPQEKDVFDQRGLRIHLVRSDSQSVKGIRVTNGRVRNLWMEKID